MVLFRRIRKGDPLSRAVSSEDINKVYDILEGIEGIGCSVNKTPSGRGWTISVEEGGGGGAGGSIDFPWKVTATPDGNGGANVTMADGYVFFIGGDGLATVSWGGANIAGTTTLFANIWQNNYTWQTGVNTSATFPYGGDATGFSIPIATVAIGSGGAVSVTQMLTSALPVYSTVEEEV
jgi:hypothetical protein